MRFASSPRSRPVRPGGAARAVRDADAVDAVELTAAALGQLQVDGPSDAQALALRDAMRVLFPEAVALVSAARQGFMRQS